jgi:hypothetical protein
MICDLRFTTGAVVRARSSVRSDIFVAPVDTQEIKPRRGDSISETLLGNVKGESCDVAPTELGLVDLGDNYKYAAPDGAMGGCNGKDRRTV